jgi:hypothetical protein
MIPVFYVPPTAEESWMLIEYNSQIDRITKFACTTQSPAVTRELERQKANLKRVAANCTKDAEELQLAFKTWHDETQILLEALDVNSGMFVRSRLVPKLRL